MHLDVLIVDDEDLARSRLRTLLGDCTEPRVSIAGEAASVNDAMALLRHTPVDAVLLDINMPQADGLSFARSLQALPHPPAVIFITAHAEHALQAFELAATDYLTKPVRLERLQKALQKIARRSAISSLPAQNLTDEALVIQERGVTERIPLREVLYLKAELKYITVRTALKTHIMEGSLNDLEALYPAFFLRIHRNALVARGAMRALEKHVAPVEGEGWAVRLSGTDEMLLVSRRQLAAVREAISR
ncbi:MAG: LytTR family DNA-binding domain-containing protein [Burkholderiaceae bacterium]|nr:LytTR family DNA-binding domain-containing protein [Burkholderiaceae bacterium]